jgi:hAT family C-terminal dimerisation region
MFEINSYFDSPIEAWPGNCEDNWLLHWWKSQMFAFPTLSQAARELLPVPSSEVDCERLFSGNRDTIGVHRYSLKSETIRVLELLRSSYQAERLENLLKYRHIRIFETLANTFYQLGTDLQGGAEWISGHLYLYSISPS